MIKSEEYILKKLKNMLSPLLDKYIDDMFLPDYKSLLWNDLSGREKYLENTIQMYISHHEEMNIKKIYSITETLKHIIKYDEVIDFKNTLIYKEIYKILSLINTTLEAQKLLNNSKEYPDGFAKLQNGKKEINTARKVYKNMFVGKYRILDRGEARLRYMIFTLYNRNKTLLNFFLHNFLVSDLFKFKALHEETKENELLLSNLEFFLMQKTTITALIKSLGILLYSEFTYYLKINKHDSEVYVKAIIYELFNESVNLYEIDRHVYIKSSLGYLPIFGTSKKSNLTNKDENFIKNKLYNELQDFYPIEETIFNIAYDSYIKNPHIQYLRKYPVELFRDNPKYTS